MFNDPMYTDKGFPASNTYLPSLKMIQQGGYGKIYQGMGKGNKGGFDKTTTKFYPGPGTYTLPTFCDNIIRRYQTLKGTMNYNNCPKSEQRKKRKGRRRRHKSLTSRGRSKNEFENKKL